jgi:hypothetical protein
MKALECGMQPCTTPGKDGRLVSDQNMFSGNDPQK